jgi:hypothetical protein
LALFTGGLASVPSQTSATTHAFSDIFTIHGTGKQNVYVTFFSRNTFQQSLTKCDFAIGSIWFHVLALLLFEHKNISVFYSKKFIFAAGRTVITSEPFS